MKYFSTDGIRGLYPNEVNEELFKAVGRVVGILGQQTVVVGYDNRPSSQSLAKSLLIGLAKSKLEIVNFGLSSTPMLQFYSLKYKCLGLMITASHNKEEYNGLKIFINGKKISKAQEEKLSIELSYIDDYYNYLIKFMPKRKYNIAIDCANGGTSKIASKLFFSSNYHIINNNIEGKINDSCGTENLDILKKYILDNSLDMGFALDGDGDRVCAISKNGKIIKGDYLLYLLASYYQKYNKLKNNAVAITRMTNLGIVEALKKNNIDVIYTDVGDKYILEAIEENNLSLGAEASGHIILYDIFPYGDGILSIMMIIQALEALNITLDELYNSIDNYYEILLNYKIDSFNFDLSSYSNVIGYVRKSGTENVYRIFLQSKNKEELQNCICAIESAYLKSLKNSE